MIFYKYYWIVKEFKIMRIFVEAVKNHRQIEDIYLKWFGDGVEATEWIICLIKSDINSSVRGVGTITQIIYMFIIQINNWINPNPLHCTVVDSCTALIKNFKYFLIWTDNFYLHLSMCEHVELETITNTFLTK